MCGRLTAFNPSANRDIIHSRIFHFKRRVKFRQCENMLIKVFCPLCCRSKDKSYVRASQTTSNSQSTTGDSFMRLSDHTEAIKSETGVTGFMVKREMPFLSNQSHSFVYISNKSTKLCLRKSSELYLPG